MISRVEIRNFQSLRSVDVDLGRFTVIVGPSSSGKSAFLRAIKAVASNVRGSSTITRGQSRTAITVRTDDAAVTLERTTSAGTYRLVTADGKEQVFGKPNGGVPEQVTQALRIEPVPAGGASVNFAGQFDKPYLVDDSGANVARTLSELTNVNVVFEAVRLANKHRLAASGTLKTRHKDQRAIEARLADFTTLPAQLKTLAEADELAQQATALQDRLGQLTAAVQRLTDAGATLERLRILPPVLDPTAMLDKAEQISQFVQLVSKVSTNAGRITTLNDSIEHHNSTAQQLQATLTEELFAAGVCPTCGQHVGP